MQLQRPPHRGPLPRLGAWRIAKGAFGSTRLDGAKFALYYDFPGLVEQGNGIACTYLDKAATAEQRTALEAIGTGKAGGGIFELFAKQLTKEWLPTRVVPIAFEMKDGVGKVRIGDVAEAESGLLSYPDGTTISPWMELPHGIEFKRGLATDAKRWWWRDGPLLGNYAKKYGAWARVRFDQTGLVG